MDNSYIKLSRKIIQWEWYKNEHTKNVFIHCLLKAYWKDTKIEGKIIPRGSFVSSVGKIAEELSLTPMEVRTALKHLNLTNEITSKGTNRNTVFTVTNYDLYQANEQTEQQTDNKQITNKEQTNNEQIANEQQPINKQLTTNEEDKEDREQEEIKEVKKEKKTTRRTKEPTVYYPNDEKLNQAFIDFMEMRNKIKKPMTDRAVTMAMNKLQKLAGTDNDLAIKILEQSVLHCWQDLYELKDDRANNKSGGGIDWDNV